MSLPGIDLSQYQAITPPLSGLAFAFARATYNLTPDTRFSQHMAAAKNVGIVRGAYHFGTAASTPAAQASAFLNSAGDAQILALDLESDAHPMTNAQAQAFIGAVRASDPLHRKILLYHSLSGFPQGLGQDANWVAAWQAAEPTTPPHAFWQYTSSGSIAGYAGRLDLDSFNGTLDQLHAMAGIASPTVQPIGPHVRVVASFKTYTVRPGTQTSKTAVVGSSTRNEPVGTVLGVDPTETVPYGAMSLMQLTAAALDPRGRPMANPYAGLWVNPRGPLRYSAS